MGNPLSAKSLPTEPLINTTFKLPSPIPPWPDGTGFATGSIKLGGLQVCQVSSFTKIWASHEGGTNDLGATFFKPTDIPKGFSMLGCYAQPNAKPLSGWVLAAKGDSDQLSLERPVDFSLIWSSESFNMKQDGHGYFWLPIPPEGYKAVGLMVTSTPEKPSFDEIGCVRSEYTEPCENESYIWDHKDANNVGFYGLRPSLRGINKSGVRVGTFGIRAVANGEPIFGPNLCLKNVDLAKGSVSAYMPSLSQVDAIMKVYSPLVYFHPDETYLPSSVSWFFNNGAILYQNGNPTTSPIDSTGSNLPQGGSEDGAYWIDLPADRTRAEMVKRGDLPSVECYLHVKPMLGATFTDVSIWLFYPFNGPARAKVGILSNVGLGKIGEHVGDWEHVTLRISNFSGELWRVYYAEHSGGTWFDVADLEFEPGVAGNKPVVYSSHNGHASYSKAGLVLQGDNKLGIGIRNDTSKGSKMDCGERYIVVAAEYLQGSVVEPPWLNYARHWGPTITYNISEEVRKVVRFFPGKLRRDLENVIKGLPAEVLGEEGPNGPKMKGNWSGDDT